MTASTGTRFWRHVALSEAFPDTANLMTPNPRAISQSRVTRTTVQSATVLNVLANPSLAILCLRFLRVPQSS